MFIDQIEQRLSVRTYQNKVLNKNDESYIINLLEQAKTWIGPFSASIQPFFITQKNMKEQEKIGTYGFVKNAPAFFGATTKNSKFELIDFGYLFEKIILELTKNNYGTVWLGGTFHRSQFNHFLLNDLIIPAISPVGYEDDKSMTEKIIRIAAKSNRRKEISEFVFNHQFFESIKPDQTKVQDIFRYVQLAPSASNKQPWRFLIDNQYIHLYLERTPKYAQKLSYDIQYLDMGIAICHLECALIDHEIKYSIETAKMPSIQEHYEYITSFILDEGFIS